MLGFSPPRIWRHSHRARRFAIMAGDQVAGRPDALPFPCLVFIPPPMSHCQRFHRLPLTRREMLLQSAFGFGSVALTALAAEEAFGAKVGIAGEPRRPGRSARPAAAAVPGQGEERDLPLHGRRAVASRYIRPQAGAGKVPRQESARGDRQSRADAVQQHRQSSEVAVEVLAARPIGERGQRTVPQRRPACRRVGFSQGHARARSASIPTPTTSSTPASACRVDPAMGRG